MVQRLGGGCSGGSKDSLDLLWGIWLGSSAAVLVVAVGGRAVKRLDVRVGGAVVVVGDGRLWL